MNMQSTGTEQVRNRIDHRLIRHTRNLQRIVLMRDQAPEDIHEKSIPLELLQPLTSPEAVLQTEQQILIAAIGSPAKS